MLLRETALVRLLGLTRIPVIFFVGPRVLSLDDDGCRIQIPLGYRTRNHVGSMYLGVLTVGADLASGMNALRVIRARHRSVVPIFKDLHAEYSKLADGDVVFETRDGRAVAEAVGKADATGERVTIPVHVTATVPEKYSAEPLAKFV